MAAFDKLTIQMSVVNVTQLLVAGFILYLVWLAYYRLVLSPLAGFPGPKLAALTSWYEFYYDAILPGQFYLQIETMHKRYGPIVRINPWELHISDPDYFEVIYNSTGRFDKVPAHQWSELHQSLASTVDHDLHKLRRKAINPFFNKRNVLNFNSFMQSRAEKMCDRLAYEYAGKEKPLNWRNVWSCFAGDNIMHYCFATNEDFLSNRDFISPMILALNEGLEMFPYFFHFPGFLKLIKAMPHSVMKFLNPDLVTVFKWDEEIYAQIAAIKQGKNQSHKDASHYTVFKEMLDADIPPQEKSVERLFQDASTLVMAGVETTSYALQLATFHVVNSPSIQKKLRTELIAAVPDTSNFPPLTELEKLPYLTAVITEAVRLSYGNVFRHPRSSPDTTLFYGPYTIPPGTPVSVGTYSIHHNETLFPHSYSFIPERWLGNPKAPALNITPLTSNASNPNSQDAGVSEVVRESKSDRPPLQKYMVSFLRGSRACVGMNLAMAELYIGIANVFRRVDMTLYETTIKDVETKRDCFVPRPVKDSKGVRVIVHKVE